MNHLKPISEKLILDLFKNSGALLEGHFKLSSGFHSDVYLQCAKVMQYPELNTLLGNLIAQKYRNEKIDLVIGPAVGGITLACEVGRQLGCRTIFAERVMKNGKKIMTLRRGFEIKKSES